MKELWKETQNVREADTKYFVEVEKVLYFYSFILYILYHMCIDFLKKSSTHVLN